MNNKLITCKACGKEMSAGAKVCPNCGAKNKKPFYTRWWFITICVIVVISAISSSGDSDTQNTVNPDAPTSAETQTVEYAAADLATMLDDLDSNALKAENTYNGKYIEFTGKISNIDSSGSYISVVKLNDDSYGLKSVMCYIKGEEQLNFIMKKSVGDQVKIRGKVKSVGEVLGYSINIDSIE